jgi:hypothetical protein
MNKRELSLAKKLHNEKKKKKIEKKKRKISGLFNCSFAKSNKFCCLSTILIINYRVKYFYYFFGLERKIMQ